MQALWLPLRDIPAQGREFSFSDPTLWTGPIAEFKLGFRVVEPFVADLRVQMHDEGCLLSGHIVGALATVCNRCAEEAVIAVDTTFDEFEDLPAAPAVSPGTGGAKGARAAKEKEALEAEVFDTGETLIRWTAGIPELNVAALFWEQFVLALPVKPLCGAVCRGLCPQCGQNLNSTDCGCDQTAGDSRLAALRGLKVERH